MTMKSDAQQLKDFLRGEMSAVETYRSALDKIDTDSRLHADLAANLQSHQERVAMLQDAVAANGEAPAEGSGPWGVWAKLVQGTANLLGDKAAVAALEEGEDHGLKDYKADLKDLSAEWRNMVIQQLLPRQEATHARLSAIKHAMK